MKKIILILVLVCLLISNAEGWYQISGWCEEKKCELCGKSLREWRESSGVGDYMTMDMSRGWVDPTEKVYSFRHITSLDICNECKEKYQEEFDEKAQQATNIIEQWIEKTREENKEKIKENEEQKRTQDLEEINQKIKELEREKELL